MSKILSEEQMFEAFMNHIDKVYYINIRKHLASPSPEIYVEQFLKDEYQAFKAAFSLLMPIIEKQMKALEDIAPIYYDSSDPNGFTPDETIAWQAIQETKQMLGKLLEEVK